MGGATAEGQNAGLKPRVSRKGQPRGAPVARQVGRMLTEPEWAEAERLYVNGATARAVAARFGVSDRTVHARMKKRGLRRMDMPPAPRPVKDAIGREAVLDLMGGDDQDEAPCRALGENATLGEAAAAAARTAINKVRALDPGRAYTWARLAVILEKLARDGGADASRLGEDPTEPGRRVALEVLRAKGVTQMILIEASDGPVWVPCPAFEDEEMEPTHG